jgi:predicted RNA methylase
MNFSKFFKTRSNKEDLPPLYHDYSFFGKPTDQLPGNYTLNQKAKGPIITAYIALAIAKVFEEQDKVTFAELFCADGYYAMVASRLGVDRSYAIDNDKDGYTQNGKNMAKDLNIDNVEFVFKDVNEINKMQKVDIVANVGGLYHVENPAEILEKSYKMAKKYLIVQNVVSLANTDPKYFETPAPGWTWGSRYSRESFDRLIKESGYNVVDSHFNELKGNSRPEDLGSAYYLIKK